MSLEIRQAKRLSARGRRNERVAVPDAQSERFVEHALKLEDVVSPPGRYDGGIVALLLLRLEVRDDGIDDCIACNEEEPEEEDEDDAEHAERSVLVPLHHLTSAHPLCIRRRGPRSSLVVPFHILPRRVLHRLELDVRQGHAEPTVQFSYPLVLRQRSQDLSCRIYRAERDCVVTDAGDDLHPAEIDVPDKSLQYCFLSRVEAKQPVLWTMPSSHLGAIAPNRVPCGRVARLILSDAAHYTHWLRCTEVGESHVLVGSVVVYRRGNDLWERYIGLENGVVDCVCEVEVVVRDKDQDHVTIGSVKRWKWHEAAAIEVSERCPFSAG